MWRTDMVTAAPDSWSVVFEAELAVKGKVTAYDSPIYIADAALYLMSTKPDLDIKNPYALDTSSSHAAVDLLKQQKADRRRVLVATTPSRSGRSRPAP